MKTKVTKNKQAKRSDSLYDLSKKIEGQAEKIKLIEDGFGHDNLIEIISELEKDCKNFLSLLKIIESVKKDGEDHDRIISC